MHCNGFFVLKQSNENMADPEKYAHKFGWAIQHYFPCNVCGEHSADKSEVGRAHKSATWHAGNGSKGKSGLEKKRGKARKREKLKRNAKFTPLSAAYSIRWLNPCALLPGSEAAKLERNSLETHRRGTREDAPSPVEEDYTQ